MDMEVNNHKFQVLTLNVRGLRQPRKRKKYISGLKTKMARNLLPKITQDQARSNFLTHFANE